MSKDKKQDVADLTLALMNRMDKKIDRLQDDINDLKFRNGQSEEYILHVMQRLELFNNRLGRIEKRLDLQDA